MLLTRERNGDCGERRGDATHRATMVAICRGAVTVWSIHHNCLKSTEAGWRIAGRRHRDPLDERQTRRVRGGRGSGGSRAMIKLYALLCRRDGLTREQFSRHWSTVHREHALRIDRIRRYVQAHGMRPVCRAR